MLQTRICWTALRLNRLCQISLKPGNKYGSADTNLFTPLSKVLFLTALIFPKLRSLKICGHVCRIFWTKDGNVENIGEVLFTALNKAWLPQSQFSWNSSWLHGIKWEQLHWMSHKSVEKFGKCSKISFTLVVQYDSHGPIFTKFVHSRKLL
jgi:hypothetical protein